MLEIRGQKVVEMSSKCMQNMSESTFCLPYERKKRAKIQTQHGIYQLYSLCPTDSGNNSRQLFDPICATILLVFFTEPKDRLLGLFPSLL